MSDNCNRLKTSENPSITKDTFQGLKTHANEMNQLFHEISDDYEGAGGEMTDKLIQKINNHFRWEQISFVMPFDKMREITEGKEW